jgi:hypothetical protein
MSQSANRKDVPTVTEVSVNYVGLKRFLGWPGSITDLKKVELDSPAVPASGSEQSSK